MGSIPLPALGVRPPQQQDPLEGMGRLMQMKSLMQGQQAQQQEIQLRQQQISDQQAMTKAFREWDGKSYDDLAKSVVSNGGSGNAALQVQQHALQVKKTVSDIAAQDATTGSKNLETLKGRNDLAIGALNTLKDVPDEQLPQEIMKTAQGLAQQQVGGQPVLDPQHTQMAQQIAQMPPQQARTQLDLLKKSMMGVQGQIEAAQKQAQTREQNATAGAKEAETQFYKNNPTLGAPGVPAETVSMADFMRKNPGASPSQFAAWKAKQEAIATQPQKLQLAVAEGKARQLVQGMAEPVYAMDGQGNKVLMSKTEALQNGSKVILPVTEKGVSDDVMLINRLGDVRQKIARYEQAITRGISSGDQGNIAALLDKNQLRVGAFGTEIPTGRFEAALQKENLAKLSPPARDLMIAYRNAAEALVGYNRVLSGSGRSNEQALNLQMQTLPDPSISDRDFAARSIGQFKENLAIVGQGLPKIPGVKSPDEIEEQVTNPAGLKSKTKSFADPLGIR